MASVREHVLESMPSLSSLYAGAATRVLRRVKEVSPDSLPGLTARVDGVDLDPGRLVAYQRLVGGTLRDTCPSVYLHGVGFPLALWVMSRPDFPLPLLGLVHLSNTVRHLRPVAPTESVTVSARAVELGVHHAGTTVLMLTTLSVGEETVWEGESLYLAKGVRLRGQPAPAAQPRGEFVPPAPTGRWRLGADTGRRYAEVMGDFNPIHLSWLSARVLGLKAPIAHGMYLAGRALAQLEPISGGFTWVVAFQTPAFLPGTVQVRLAPTRSAAGQDPQPGSSEFRGWSPRNNKPHFDGSITPAA